MNAIEVPCPTCGAGYGEPCLVPSGKVYDKHHVARRLAAQSEPTCRVRMFANTRSEANPRPCGEPLVTDLCVRHQADRVRLGGAS